MSEESRDCLWIAEVLLIELRDVVRLVGGRPGDLRSTYVIVDEALQNHDWECAVASLQNRDRACVFVGGPYSARRSLAGRALLEVPRGGGLPGIPHTDSPQTSCSRCFKASTAPSPFVTL